jgi:hypothetical protein
MPPAPVSGPTAVQKAADQGALSAAESAATPGEEALGTVRILGSRTYVLSDGVWIDTAFDPEKMKTIKVAFLSDDYFALARSDAGLAASFSLGKQVISYSNGSVYEVVDEGSRTAPIHLPGTQTPAPANLPLQSQTQTPATSPAQASNLPCLGGLLPIVLIALVVWIYNRHHLSF